jgi:hypothetical protein
MNLQRMEDLHASGRMTWIEDQRGWRAQPSEIVDALAHSGFHEYKREEARGRRDRRPSGGVWQGIDTLTGSVASAVWVNQPDVADAIVFIDIDGVPWHA